MRIKRFEAPDTSAALNMVKEEMGDDAVILATRKISGSRGKPLMEVVAAMDYDLEKLADSADQADRFSRSAKSPAAEHFSSDNTENRGPEFPSPRFSPDRKTGRSQPQNPSRPIHTEARDLRVRFSNFFAPGSDCTLQNRGPTPDSVPPPQRHRPDPEHVARWRNQLIDQVIVDPLTLKDRGPTIIAMVGPTGVGKTTTAAKIAAWFSLRENRKVAMVSMDCYRIGATEQLRTYARIMRIPCEIALRQEDFERAIARHQDKDLIIIDTAGKNPYDADHINELNAWFAPYTNIEPYLVLSATSKKEDLNFIIKSYRPLHPEGLILTKIDETRAYANLCREMVAAGIPLACLCTGQRVPEDFRIASRKFIETLFGRGWDAAISQQCETEPNPEAWQ